MRFAWKRWWQRRRTGVEKRWVILARWRAELRGSPVLRGTAALTMALILVSVLSRCTCSRWRVRHSRYAGRYQIGRA
jgi:hypothetical protein